MAMACEGLRPRAPQPQPVAPRCHRVHDAYEIGGAPTAPQRRHRRQRGLDLAPRLGGPQPYGGPLKGARAAQDERPHPGTEAPSTTPRRHEPARP